MGREILVDGYNVIKKTAALAAAQKVSLEHARDLLIKQLHSTYRHTPDHVTVVFDGDRPTEQETHKQGMSIIFSRRGEPADLVIIRLAAKVRAEGRDVVTVSDDLEVRQGVTRSGSEVRSSAQLAHKLNAPSRDVEQKIRHRQKTIRDYGLNPAYKPEDNDCYNASHKGKKSPRRRK